MKLEYNVVRRLGDVLYRWFIFQPCKKSTLSGVLSPCIYSSSWTTTNEDLLLTTEPFQESTPLAEMVDFLVDIWLEEGLYD